MHALVLAPAPQSLVYGRGRFRAAPALVAALSNYTLGASLPGVTIRRRARLTGGSPEAYRLDIGRRGIVIDVQADAGLYCAAMTLRQILRQVKNRLVPRLTIRDYPDFPARGVMLDISRDKVPTMKTLFGLIDRLSEFKVNQFQLYMEHTFAYRRHKVVWEEASPMTPEQIRALDAYCAARNIELVPNQNSFGHMERWLIHPAYRPLAESPDGWSDPWGGFRNYPFTLNPIDPASLRLIKGLYRELLPHFKSSLFNVGCDETFDLGQGRSKEACDRLGKGKVYLDYILKIHRAVSARKRVMQMWGDTVLLHPESIRHLPKDAILLDWGYEAGHPFDKETRAFKRAGLKFYVCPGTSSWNSIAGRYSNAMANLRNAAENGLRNGAAGYLITDWGDNGHLQQLPISYPGFLYGAALSWSVLRNRPLDVENALSLHVFSDPTGRLARALRLLGDLYLKPGPVSGNESILSTILLEASVRLRAPKKVGQVMSLSPLRLRTVLHDLKIARALIGKARPKGPEGKQASLELDFTARLLEYACSLALARVTTRDKFPSSIPAPVRRKLIDRLNALMKEYRFHWMGRNRIGGLSDSLKRFRMINDYYSGAKIELV